MTIDNIDKFIQDNNITHIYLDIDGVLFASCQACADILNEMQGTDFNGSDVLSWDFKNICPNITLEEIEELKDFTIDINDIDEKTKKALIEADNNTDKKGIEAAKYIVTGEKIKKEMSNIKHVINAKTEEAMRKMLDNQVKDKNDSNEEKEISD